MKRNKSILLSDPMENVLLKDEIEKLQLQLQAEEMRYREALREDKVFEEVKPIRLRIKFLQQKIDGIKSGYAYPN